MLLSSMLHRENKVASDRIWSQKAVYEQVLPRKSIIDLPVSESWSFIFALTRSADDCWEQRR